MQKNRRIHLLTLPDLVFNLNILPNSPRVLIIFAIINVILKLDLEIKIFDPGINYGLEPDPEYKN